MPAIRTAARLGAVAVAVIAAAASVRPAHPLSLDQQLVASLPAAATAPTPGYDRDLFPTWADLDGDGCDARQAVLLRALENPVTAEERPTECTIVLSGWLQDPYTGEGATVASANVDIDHRVALQDAWASGANTWTEEWRKEFANDEDNLEASLPGVNRSKGARGPDQWVPTGGKAARCAYASGYAHTKARWELGVTDKQRAALIRLLEGC